MRLYLDTSVFVSITTNEAIAPRVQLWFAAQDVNDIVISDWVLTEFYAAVAFKRRTTQISAEMRAGAEKLFEQYVADSLMSSPFPDVIFKERASSREMKHSSFVRVMRYIWRSRKD